MIDLFSLKDKVIIITGATGLLGSQHATVVAEAGGIPVLLDLDQSRCDQLSNELKQKFDVEAVGYKVDITKEEEIIENISLVRKKFKHIHGLINNAANNPKVEDSTEKAFSRLENFPVSVWNMDIAVGLTGSFLCAKHYGYLISQNPEGGSILNISSDLGLIAPDQRLYRKVGLSEDLQPVKPVTYSVVKAGLIGLTRYLATYWADKNVRCNAICPGGVENNQNPEFLKEVKSRIPLGRMAKKDEYKGLVLFLLSDSASYLNGSIVSADGGRTVW
ncbi:SDR family oxidoreductase [Leptospira levettii]|uniref:SDR family oxidoreductase n=1 Tax=Leptospira levettii TaxID=2023178 RepID=A0AAW5VEE9_9LEPT|nr:SDR family oxidoreductase [Leptospira levettii]MCW7466201.1 SDR family oxidoreductase [Leptospira levettii]MCW7512274.1 SDR family oxidoreductase [Leptospira levettii]MCW7516282.1 SDR family oxidoreductase [Leptospira levettii]